MKKIIAALLTLVMAAVPAGSAYCSGADSIVEETGQDVSELIDEETDYSTGTPWICSMIEGTVTADTPADPKDDFYLSVNKEKMLSTGLPEDKSETDAFSDIDEKVSKELKDMFSGEPPQNHDAKLAYDLYQMAFDWDTRNALGVAPLKKLLDEIEAISSIDELTAYFTKPVNGETCTKLWRSSSTIDPTHSDRYVLAVYLAPEDRLRIW